MATSTIATQEDKTIEITMTVPWKDIQKEYDKAVGELIKQVEVKGFRKGKAPRNVAEKELDKNKVYEHIIRTLVPKLYQEAVKTHNITPIMTPEVTLSKAEEGKDWEIKAKTCELPEIKAEKYKDIVKKAKADLKKDDLWLPGKDPKPEEDQDLQAKKQKSLSAIMEALLKQIPIVIPSVLVKSESERRLTALLDDVKKLGLTIDSYAKSKNMTPEQVRASIEQEIANTYKLEFILEFIADKEGITVDEKEIQQQIDKAQSAEEKQQLEKNKYYLSNMLRRQKTLDRLLGL